MRSSIAIAAFSALLVAADNATYTIDVDEVALATRASWCQGQESTCNTLCDGNAEDNSCDVTTLEFDCTCASNSSAPGLQYYTQTIDTYVCQQAYEDCIDDNENDATAQKNCTTSIQDNCGSLNPDDYTAASTSTSSSAAASTATASSTSSSTAASSTASAASAANANFQRIGTGALAAGMGVLAYLL